MSKVLCSRLSILAAVFVLFASSGARTATAASKMPAGFYYPTSIQWSGKGDTQQPPGKSKIFGWLATDQDSPPYPERKSHRGIDIYGAYGSQVRALTRGVVVMNDTKQSDTLNKNLWIKHYLKGGGTFYAVYGHISSSLKEGVTVNAGQSIGKIAEKRNPHIHLGIHPAGISYPWGRGPIPYGWSIERDRTKSRLPLEGWVAPRTFLEKNLAP